MTATLKQMRYVCAVADAGSVLRAAEAMRIAPSSVLAAIEAAEIDLGARIFDRRRGRGAQATSAGERYVAAARQLLAAEVRFSQRIKGLDEERGPLRIGCFEPFGSIFLVEVLRRLQARSGPLEVSLVEADQPRLKRYLERGEVDLVLAYDLGPEFEGDVTKIARAPPHALVAEDGPFGARESVSIEELARTPLVLLSQPLTVTYLLTLFNAAATRPEIAFRTRSYDTVIRAVAAGFGAAVLNMRPPAPLAVEAGCRRLALEEDLAAPWLIAVDNYGDRKPRPVAEFLETVIAYFNEAGAEGPPTLRPPSLIDQGGPAP